MQVDRLSKSGIETFDDCEHKFNLQYNLGFKSDDNASAVMGNVFHTIMEILAHVTKNKNTLYKDEFMGEIEVDGDMVKLTELVYNKYKDKYSHLDLTNTQLTNCKRWVKRTLEDNNGRYDPRNLNILDIERWFDFNFDNVNVRGFIDLVTKEDNNTIKCLDWKTGSDWNFKLNKKKDYEYFNKNFQLRLYHYVLSKLLYPEVENIITEIFFVNTYKVFSFFWGPEELHKVEIFLNKKIDKIRAIEKPKTNYNSCKICSFDKHQYKDSGETICSFFKRQIEEKGLEETNNEFKVKK